MKGQKDAKLENDAARWAEPFSAMYARIRYQSYLVLGLVVVILVLGIELFVLGSRASAHVYEVRPDGSAEYIGDRSANVAPRAAEAKFVAKRFTELLIGWNSSTALKDVTDAVNMCSKPMATQLAEELATQQFVANLRKRNIRSEIQWREIEVAAQSDRDFRVRVTGRTDIYPLGAYQAEPIDSREFANVVVLAVVPRDASSRLNGLEVVRIERVAPAAPESNATKGGNLR
jgi:hypothetical protein